MEAFKIIFVLILTILGSTAHWYIKDVAKNLSNEIEELKNNELGVPFVLNLYKNFVFIQPKDDLMKIVNNIAHKLETKITDIFSVLESSQLVIDTKLSKENSVTLNSSVTPCFLNESLRNQYNNNSYNSTENPLESINILDKMKQNFISISEGVKRQYFISDYEIKQLKRTPFLRCSESEENIIWSNYMKRNIYQQKNLILVLDIGGSMNQVQFNLLKSVAKGMLSVLNESDRVSVSTISSNFTYLENDCNILYGYYLLEKTPVLKQATSSYIQNLEKYIDAIISEPGLTNHTLGFEKSLEIVVNSADLVKNETIMILYVSRGLLSSLMEPKEVLEMVEKFTRIHNITSLFINTCAIIDELKPVVYEPQFLCDIAYHNYSKYNIPFKPNPYRKLGMMLKVENLESIPFVVERFYSVFNPHSNFEIGTNIHSPSWDKSENDLMVSFTKGWKRQNKFFMLGVDVYFSNLAEDLVYYSNVQGYSYVFLMDLKGKIAYHPYYLRVKQKSQSHAVDLENIEKVSNIANLKRRILSEKKGIFQDFRKNNSDLVQYRWNRISDWYVVCLVTNTKYGVPSIPQKSIWFQNDFLYQNFGDYKLCRHLNILATIDVFSLYLSPSCFRSPFLAAHLTQNKLRSEDFVAYLKDDSRLLINPGLKEEIREEVSLLSHILMFLRKRHLQSEISNYIVRRYASSNSGVFQMFPGSTIKPGWSPTKSLWFYKASQHRGKAVLVPPYLDKGGAGYVITIAYATSQFIIGMDVTYGFILKMLITIIPECLNKNITCFLIDDEGYIIYHPNLMNSNGAKPIEQQHIVHKESLVSNDILNHKHFIQKLLCNSYGDDTIQRYYALNTSFVGVLVNFVPGEQCVKYQITSIPKTNMFLGIVNVSCNFGATFCPCSIIDRLCLNCKRMEQKECECPCECPLENSDICDTKPNSSNVTDNVPCKKYAEESLGNSFIVSPNNNLESCFVVSCYEQKTYLDCLGLIGCEWCMFDMNRNYLRKPFCASISTCFKGIFDISDTSFGRVPNSVEFSSAGPIIYSIIGITVLFVLLLVCYRSYSNQITDRLYVSSTQDQLRMSDLNITDNFHDLGNHRDKLIQEEHLNVSPYCVAGTYRRTTGPTDSDHGYSTMTPHDESEHMSLAPVEVDSLEDDIFSDSTSAHTSLSNKDTPRLFPPVSTRIPQRNCITVPVTVHQNAIT
ncbi:VWFA and cache domain-containing protein 1 isoform X1 [Diorhabda sublineata]|uniref:VWFA and cache domain-containing protein 1 isoform X1 n=1 Tax=Diorhabda sublineata TaxID=1163346 RepID=UPI0024E06DAC|nr:VWFA and cache domain-containing protein 1 isoform X1 [Diorhabda sublineata]